MSGRRKGHALPEREILLDEAARTLIQLRGSLCLDVMQREREVDITQHGGKLEAVERALEKLRELMGGGLPVDVEQVAEVGTWLGTMRLRSFTSQLLSERAVLLLARIPEVTGDLYAEQLQRWERLRDGELPELHRPNPFNRA